MKTRLSLSLFALSLATGTAFAQATPAAPASAPRAESARAAEEAKVPDAIDHVCLRETGTLIRPRRERASNERCPSHVYGRAWTQDDLRSTGAIDIAQALRMLDPSIH